MSRIAHFLVFDSCEAGGVMWVREGEERRDVAGDIAGDIAGIVADFLPKILPEELVPGILGCCGRWVMLAVCRDIAGIVAGGWERAVETAPRGACGRHKVRLRGLERGEGVAVVSIAVFAAVSDCARRAEMEFTVAHVTIRCAMVGLVADFVAGIPAVFLAGDVAGITITGNPAVFWQVSGIAVFAGALGDE